MKYCVQIYYITHIFEEVEAGSPEEAVDAAKAKIDALPPDTFRQAVADNLAYDEAQVWPKGREDKIHYL